MVERLAAKKLVIYLGESHRAGAHPLSDALLHLLQKKGIAGASLFRGLAGFGRHRVLHTAAILRLSEDLPLRIEAVDTPAKIEEALPEVLALVRGGLVEIEDVMICREEPVDGA